MKKYLLLLLLIAFTIEDIEEPLNLNLEGLENGRTEACFTVEDNLIKFTCSSQEYKLTGTSAMGLFILYSDITLTLNEVQITTTGTSTPLIIGRNCVTTINLSGINTLQDVEDNVKDAVIYMESGSKLTISSTNTDASTINLSIIPSKGKGIFGGSSTNLIINGGIIKLVPGISTGFIQIGNDFMLNKGNIVDTDISDSNIYFSVKAGGSIKIEGGACNFHSIQADKNIVLGRPLDTDENPNTPVASVIIKTDNEGMKAKNVEILNIGLEIESKKDSIISYSDIKIVNSNLKIKAGSSDSKNSPFTSGELSLSGCSASVYATNCISSGIKNDRASVSYNEIPAPENQIEIWKDGIGSSLATFNSQGIYTYFYWTDKTYQLTDQNQFKIKKDGEEVQAFDDSTCVEKKKKKINNSKFLKFCGYLYILTSLLLF